MKNIIKNCFKFIQFLYNEIWTILFLATHGGNIKPFYYKNRTKGITDCFVLANGPSLKKDLAIIVSERKYEKSDVAVMNYFAFDDNFTIIQPKHYCLADPMFIDTNNFRHNEVRKLYDELEEKVNWAMTIYIPAFWSVNKFREYSKINRQNINIVSIRTDNYNSFPSWRFKLYKYGMSSPRFDTVALLDIYICLNSGYKNIFLYGVDNSFFDSLYVNDNNELCQIYRHFYDNTAEPKPIRHWDGHIYKVHEYLNSLKGLFEGHLILSEYSQYLGVNILNCTKKSMLDTYPRIKS